MKDKKINWNTVKYTVLLVLGMIIGIYITYTIMKKPKPKPVPVANSTETLDSLINKLDSSIYKIKNIEDSLLNLINIKRHEIKNKYKTITNYRIINANDSLARSVAHLSRPDNG